MEWTNNVALGVGATKKAPYTLYSVNDAGELRIMGDGWKEKKLPGGMIDDRPCSKLGTIERAKEVAELMNAYLIEQHSKETI